MPGRSGVDLPSVGDVGQDLGELQVPAHQALVADDLQDAVVVGAAAQAAPQGAAVGADLFDRHDHRVGRQGDASQGGELAVGGQLRQRRSLLGGLGACVARHRDGESHGAQPREHVAP